MPDYYYFDPKKIDIGKLRVEAAKKALGDSRNKPEISTIHHHAHGASCKGKTHERVHPREHSEPGTMLMEETQFERWEPTEERV